MIVLSCVLCLAAAALREHSASAFVLDASGSGPNRGVHRGVTPLEASSNYLQTLTRTDTGQQSSSPQPSWQQPSSSPRTPYSSPTWNGSEAPSSSSVTLKPPATTAVELQKLERLGSTQAPAGHAQKVPDVQQVPKLKYEEYGDVNSEVKLSMSTFPIKSSELIEIAKDAVFSKGLGLNDDGECLADNFSFRGALVESKKEEFLKALKTFNLGKSFRIKQQYFGWLVDPIQHNRVWFMNRQEATHIKEFFGAKADGKKLILPPESLHVDFDEEGRVTEFGFYTVDRFQGNTGGLGGAFGYFYGVGKPLPFPEGHPYKLSFRRRLFETLGTAITNFKEYRKTTLKPAAVKCKNYLGDKVVRRGRNLINRVLKK